MPRLPVCPCESLSAEDTKTNLPSPLVTVALLVASNDLMTCAWYGRLSEKSAPLWIVIGVSWGIAFFEYVLQVPANRIGRGSFSAAELKTIQEIITLWVFAVFSVCYLKEPLHWNRLVGFGFIAAGGFSSFTNGCEGGQGAGTGVTGELCRLYPFRGF